MANEKAASPADLRKARQARLAASKAKTADPTPAVEEAAPALTEEPVPAVEEPAPVVEEVAPEPVEEIPEQLTAAVLNPTEVSKTAEISLTIFNEKSQDPHWLVCAGGRPLAEIRLSDQDEPEKLAKVFVSDAYANGVVEASTQMELPELLVAIKARPYIATVNGTDAFKALEERVKSAAQEELRKTKSNLRDDFLNTLSLVVTAQTKNYITENALKGALFTQFAKTGMEEDRIVAAIEDSWQEAASEYFEQCFKQASKWMDLAPEAYADIAENIQGMSARGLSLEVEAEVAPSKNVPLLTLTASAEEPASEHDKIRDTLNLRRGRYNGIGV